MCSRQGCSAHAPDRKESNASSHAGPEQAGEMSSDTMEAPRRSSPRGCFRASPTEKAHRTRKRPMNARGIRTSALPRGLASRQKCASMQLPCVRARPLAARAAPRDGRCSAPAAACAHGRAGPRIGLANSHDHGKARGRDHAPRPDSPPGGPGSPREHAGSPPATPSRPTIPGPRARGSPTHVITRRPGAPRRPDDIVRRTAPGEPKKGTAGAAAPGSGHLKGIV